MWMALAIWGVLSGAAMSIGQQKLKADTIPMLLWLRLASFLAVSPLLIWVTMPTVGSFYIWVALFALLIVYLDIANFRYIGEFGAAVAVRLATITSIPAFFLWVAVDQQTFSLYLDHPFRAGLIISVVCLAAYLATTLRHCTVTVAAVKRLWPVMLFGVLSPTFAKLVVTSQPDPLGAIVTYLLVVCVVSMICLSGFMLLYKQRFRESFQSIKNIKSGILLAACSVSMIFSSYLAYMLVYNPAYVSVVFLTVPVIVSLYNRLTGHPDDSNKIAGFGLVFCAMMLAILKI
jgi:hypothetical protein